MILLCSLVASASHCIAYWCIASSCTKLSLHSFVTPQNVVGDNL